MAFETVGEPSPYQLDFLDAIRISWADCTLQ